MMMQIQLWYEFSLLPNSGASVEGSSSGGVGRVGVDPSRLQYSLCTVFLSWSSKIGINLKGFSRITATVVEVSLSYIIKNQYANV